MKYLKDMGFKNLSYLMNPGIYVLLLQGEVVYVGQTRDIFARIGASPDHRGRDYDEIYFIKCPLHELDRVEALMINKLKPRVGAVYNFNNNTDHRNRPTEGAPGEATLNLTVLGHALSVPLKRRL